MNLPLSQFAPDTTQDGIIKLAALAVGGQGGGVLTGWIEAVARSQGYAVQATSVAGVAPWIVPPPLTTEKVTVTPATGSPAASRTTTDGAKGTASPAAAC